MADISQMSLPDGNTYDIVDSKSRWEGTQAQYDALSLHDPNVIYYITDGVSANVSVINDLSDVAILSPQNGQSLIYNSASQKWENNNYTATDFTSSVTFEDTPGSATHFYKEGNIIYINFQGASKTNRDGNKLFTLPSNCRPIDTIYSSFVMFGTTISDFGTISINSSSGICTITNISNERSGRVYFNVAYPIV